ncbi:sigma-54 interaction domain-containing protein [Oceanobacillus massiliensis]|uniref:sigma-54 interaction domain-containing protein n=1 Tax=Oceanobacillus massiliensis TaxID=1465765 RepID=UPI000288A14D|nr:sigma-54-dependent Fis family transcriptional regulator [Oceanobacillus massiliensis]
MKRVLIIGAGKGGTALINLLQETERMEIAAVVDTNVSAEGLKQAAREGIPIGSDWADWMEENIDIIIEATGNEQVLEEIIDRRPKKTIVIPGSVAYIISELLYEKESLMGKMKYQSERQHLILNHIHDGMIVIDRNEKVQFINKSAEKILDKTLKHYKDKNVKELISSSRLPHVLQSKRKEVNQKITLENGKRLVSTRNPIINEIGELVGAFAVFKDITEVMKLAEENTDLNEIKTMLEAIIKSSDEAISVVDEHGLGLIINPAYTRITGLKETDVIGQPATVDISEGESMHMKVLQTRRPVRGVHMKVGPAKKDVIVNVAPVIVKGIIKGSVGVLHDVTEIQSLTKELKRARQIIRNLEARYTFDDIIGSSPEMRLALEQAKVGAKTPATVLLRGESGTGKELFAHAIHNESERKHHKFIRVNCAAVAESLLESELFGYEEGAFTGAQRGGKKGLFEEANNGSIFLDEIGELSMKMQAKLLRVLQEQEIVRVGSTKPISIDVRIITATHVNLEKAIMNRTFREDLYYRLNKLPIFIPSVKERIDDLPELIDHIIQKINQDYGRNVQTISDSALSKLMHYEWPGNVRELGNVISRAMIFMTIHDEKIEQYHLPELHNITKQSIKRPAHVVVQNDSLQTATESFEKDYIQTVYEQHAFNKTKTARALDISIRNLYYKMEKYQID